MIFPVHTLINNLVAFNKKGKIKISSDPTRSKYSYRNARFLVENDTLIIEFSDILLFPPVFNDNILLFLKALPKTMPIILRNVDTYKEYDIIGTDEDDPNTGTNIYLYINDDGLH